MPTSLSNSFRIGSGSTGFGGGTTVRAAGGNDSEWTETS